MKNAKSTILIIPVLILCFFLSSFSKNHIKKVEGYVRVYGNEPFTYIGIKTSDKKEYAISADEERIAELWQSQGNLIEITGYIVQKEKDQPPVGFLKDGKIEVTEWKYVK